MRACVSVSREGGFTLRAVDLPNPGEKPADGGATPGPTADANGGRPAAAATNGEATSTNLDAPWAGTRDYIVAPGGENLAAFVGHVVEVRGTLERARAQPDGAVDQVLARRGARFPVLRPTSVTDLHASCVDPAAVDRVRGATSATDRH